MVQASDHVIKHLLERVERLEVVLALHNIPLHPAAITALDKPKAPEVKAPNGQQTASQGPRPTDPVGIAMNTGQGMQIKPSRKIPLERIAQLPVLTVIDATAFYKWKYELGSHLGSKAIDHLCGVEHGYRSHLGANYSGYDEKTTQKWDRDLDLELACVMFSIIGLALLSDVLTLVRSKLPPFLPFLPNDRKKSCSSFHQARASGRPVSGLEASRQFRIHQRMRSVWFRQVGVQSHAAHSFYPSVLPIRT
ncbi:hypothetical protein V8E36_005210 [Tilletia maclaganii]